MKTTRALADLVRTNMYEYGESVNADVPPYLHETPDTPWTDLGYTISFFGNSNIEVG